MTDEKIILEVFFLLQLSPPPFSVAGLFSNIIFLYCKKKEREIKEGKKLSGIINSLELQTFFISTGKTFF